MKLKIVKDNANNKEIQLFEEQIQNDINNLCSCINNS